MHRIVLALSCLVLAACTQAQREAAPADPDLAATQPVVTATTVPEETSPPPLPAEKPAAPRIPLDELIGMEDEAVMALIGPPDLRQDRAPAIAWVYDNTGCPFGLLLYPDLETNRRTVLSYETDDPDSCAAAMVTR